MPELSGPIVRGYRATWFVLLIISVFANCAAPYFNRQMRTNEFAPFADLGLRQWDGRRLQVPHRPSLERAGVVAGSELVAIAGEPVPADATLPQIARRLAAQPSPVAVTIRSPDGIARNFNLVRDPRWIELSYVGTGLTSTARVVLDLVFAGLANLALIAASALLLWRRPRDRLAALLSLSFIGFAAFENLTFYTWRQLGLLELSAALSSIAFAGILVGLVLSPDGRFHPRWTRWVAVALGAGVAISTVLEHLDAPGWLPASFVVGPALLVVPAMRSRFKVTPVGSEPWQQQRWLLLGMSLAAAAMVATFILNNLAQSTSLARQQLVWIYVLTSLTLSLVTLFVTTGLLVAVLRYRLYDAEAALSRSAGLAIVGLAFAGLFAGFAKAIELAVEQISGNSAGAAAGIAAAVLATLVVTPAQTRIQNWTDGRFRKALSHLRRDLPDCVDDLRETASLEELATEVLRRVVSGVQVTCAAIETGTELIAFPAECASPADWAVRLPLQVRHGDGTQEGWLLVGRRPDHSPPSREELDALTDILEPVSRALRVVRARETKDRDHARRWQEIQTRLASLERRMLEGQG